MFRKRHRIGEILPEGDLSLDDTIIIETGICKCGKQILKQPMCTIEHLPRYYDSFKYVCLFCKWESTEFRKRTL